MSRYHRILGRKRPASRELNHDAKRMQLVDELSTVDPSSAIQKKVHEQFEEKVDYNRPEAKHETIPIQSLSCMKPLPVIY
jgi:hypothetical protein